MDPADVIRAALKATGLSQVEFSKATGVSQPTISKWLNGTQRPGFDQWQGVQRYLRRNPTTRRLAKIGLPPGDDLLEDVDSPQGISTMRPYQPRLEHGMPVVDLGSGAGAGGGGFAQTAVSESGGILYEADAIRGEIVLPPPVLSSLTRAAPNRLHWFDIRGDSMEPTLSGGDLVCINTADTAVGQGGVFALRDPYGEVLIKRLRRASPEEIEIVSDNPKQGNKTELVSDIVIFGRVVARITRVG